ncbi:hypothetical protein [Rhizobium sp. 9140]|uniref:hypothetical protein n=1 Tax=Rhizobium sp. 9140 TaxID=1761900 RepID=UPI000796F32E|nr:hypothetical protein [Rhizobium sp. 9140]CZT36132.1 hypothetical protein GA0004734_00031340 [Rhizobium sp. 9140]
MATIIRTTKRKRGLFGTLVWWLFLAFNALMAIGLYAGITATGKQYQGSSDAAFQAGTAIGGTIAVGGLLFIWLTGSLILGLIVALTKGKEVMIEKTVD